MAGSLRLIQGLASVFYLTASLIGDGAATTYAFDLVGGPLAVPPPHATSGATALPVAEKVQATIKGIPVAVTGVVSGIAGAQILTVTFGTAPPAGSLVAFSCKFYY
jgi:hypothetical protein